jgi:hypothetical protein
VTVAIIDCNAVIVLAWVSPVIASKGAASPYPAEPSANTTRTSTFWALATAPLEMAKLSLSRTAIGAMSSRAIVR